MTLFGFDSTSKPEATWVGLYSGKAKDSKRLMVGGQWSDCYDQCIFGILDPTVK